MPFIIRAFSIAVPESWNPRPRFPWCVAHFHALTAESSIQKAHHHVYRVRGYIGSSS